MEVRIHPRRRTRDEKGASLVFIAIAVVALVAVSGLVIDGGSNYAERRQMQNTADAAALAGTIALDKYQSNPALGSASILAAVDDKVDDNAPGDSTFTCELLDDSRTTSYGACPSTDATPIDPNAASVRVTARRTQETSFMKIAGFDTFSATADATAQIQALIGGTSPFMFCATDASLGQKLLVESPAGSNNWIINTAAIYPGNPEVYTLHDTSVPDCGNGSSGFKGLVDTDNTYGVPGWWDNKTGVTAGPVRTALAEPDACGDDLIVGCKLVVPLCIQGNGQNGTNFEMYCVRFGTFQITYSDPNTHRAVFLGAGFVSGGQGGGKPIEGEARLIKLTE